MFTSTGHVEQDPLHIWEVTEKCLRELVTKAKQEKNIELSKENVLGVGIANQRETTIVWDKTTGEPLCPAIGE